MLQSLHIKNIALIQECNLELGNGLNILTGETGAGKSIIIDAFSFVLGAKADKSLIRYGETKAQVEAVFVNLQPITLTVMEELGLEQDDTIIINRSMTETKNEIKVNGCTFTLAMLKKLTSTMVDILGQHEHHSLMNVSEHLRLLDTYAGKDVAVLTDNVLELYQEYKAIKKKLASFGDERERARKLDSLSYIIKEIEKAHLVDGEEEELIAQRDKFRNSEHILEGVKSSYGVLDGEEISALSLLNDAISSVRSASSYDSTLKVYEDRLESAKIEIKDIADSLYDYGENFDYDENTASKIERRVDLIRSLKRKYGNTIADVLSLYEKSKEEYDSLTGADIEIEKLNNNLSNTTAKLYNSAVKLSKARKEAAKIFEKGILKELSDLAMSNTTFDVEFNPLPDIEELDDCITSKGFDNVCFNISPNKGEPMRPLSKIASGGEMSRFMLALKNITAGLDGIDTMVFDEIDTGISGNVALVVAQKMYNISGARQVIAVTHLPQLASYADRQYLIAKEVVGDKTLTGLTLLDDNRRKEELVRLTGGMKGNDIGLLHAEELLKNAQAYKNSKK